MRRRLFIFLIAISPGVGIFGACDFFQRDSVETRNTALNDPVEALVENAVHESDGISPCPDADSFQHEINFREKAVALGNVYSRILCGELPEYPENLKNKKISGEVTVWLTINEAGEVSSTKFLDGNKLFSESARKAAYRTKFQPFLFDGKARRTFGVLIYDFMDGEVKLREIN